MQLNKTRIFVGGIHGVGKTTICQRISKEIRVEHYSASDLIKKIVKSDFQKNKHTIDIRKNQNILIEAIARFIPLGQPFILDGHFCLLDNEGAVTKVPYQTFKDIGLSAFIVFIKSPEEIANQIEQRDGRRLDSEKLKAFQNTEVEYAKEIAKRLNVPLLILDMNDNLANCKEFIRNHTK